MESLREFYKIGNGPSSSHTMGPEKAAKEFRKIIENIFVKSFFRIIILQKTSNIRIFKISDNEKDN